MNIEIITSTSGDWGVCKINGTVVSEGHDVKYSEFISDIFYYLNIKPIYRQISDEDMEEGNY